MSEFTKHYVGRDAASASDNGVLRPVSRVTLFLDGSSAITAGDDTGFELTADCPHADQAMADALLQKLRGVRYQMVSAGAARVDPAAELGDGMTVDGMYSILARVRDDGSGYPDLEAPGQAEVEDEYPGAGPLQKALRRQIADTRSSIAKTAEEIRLEVERTYATRDDLTTTETRLSSSITQTAEDIVSQVSAGYATKTALADAQAALAQSLSRVEQTADKIGWLVKSGQSESDFTLTDRAAQLVSETIDLSGFVTISSLAEPGKTTVSGGNIHGDTLTLGGRDNQEGALSLLDGSGQAIGTLDRSGLSMLRTAKRDGIMLYPGCLDFSPVGPIAVINAGESFDGDSGNTFDVLVDLNRSKFTVRPSSRVTLDVTPGSGYIVNDTPVFAVDRAYDGNIDNWVHRLVVNGYLVCRSSKNRLVEADELGERLLYSYETASPLFGDVGEGTLDERGECLVMLDQTFVRAAATAMAYQVFLQPNGPGALWVGERAGDWFTVRGEPGLAFSWEVKAAQRGFEDARLNEMAEGEDPDPPVSYEGVYGAMTEQWIEEREEFDI